ncbi:MAG: hypothetical protein K1X92_06815 [Bacteroidia bacterium]|nr:hypothetical protein [Bacteroidia bacterium]
MTDFVKKWIRISLFNLTVVAFIGVIMRYKILYSLPFVDQKHLLQGHSNFAFCAWVSQCLMALMLLYSGKGESSFRKYNLIFIVNTLSGWGMLIFFVLQGYSIYSAFFSILAALSTFLYIYNYVKDTQKGKSNRRVQLWFRASFVFYVLAALGSFYLMYIMLNKITDLHQYLATTYFFLHFLYNGWFFFASMGLLAGETETEKEPGENQNKKLFLLFAVSCVPAYFLSVLWANLPLWVYIPLVFFTLTQLAGGIYLLWLILRMKSYLRDSFSVPVRCLWGISLICLMIKLLLQTGSVYPALSDLAFGFRPIVVGYLHLVLLGIFSTFLLGYILHKQWFKWYFSVKYGIILFTAFILINEFLLMIQGIASIKYFSLPFINHLLLIAALMMFTGLILIQFWSQKKRKTGDIEAEKGEGL